jgi:hypothetical protein
LPARPWAFVKSWGVKHDKAVECLTKDRDALLAFYDFPVEHWKHPATIANWPRFSAGTIPSEDVRRRSRMSKARNAVALRGVPLDTPTALRSSAENEGARSDHNGQPHRQRLGQHRHILDVQ